MQMTQYVWTEDETLIKLIKYKRIMRILESNQQINATIYQDLEEDMREKNPETTYKGLSCQ